MHRASVSRSSSACCLGLAVNMCMRFPSTVDYIFVSTPRATSVSAHAPDAGTCPHCQASLVRQQSQHCSFPSGCFATTSNLLLSQQVAFAVLTRPTIAAVFCASMYGCNLPIIARSCFTGVALELQNRPPCGYYWCMAAAAEVTSI